MLDDFRQYPHDSRLACDVAIVGAGAAGLTLARHLAGRGLEVCVLESGGLDFDAATQALAAGENHGAPYYPLIDARLRFFGGTTNIWGGRCARFSPLDFAPRSWVSASGWPLSLDELEPWYARAAADCELGAQAATAAGWTSPLAAEFGLAAHAFESPLWRFDDVDERFSAGRARDLCDSPDVRILLHATVVRVMAAAEGRTVVGLELAHLAGRRATLTARYYVLAAGGIENARLLLASDDVVQGGIGNAHDQVGRCFMEHPHGRAAILDAGAGFALWAAFQRQFGADGTRVAPVLVPSAALQARHGILNSAFTFKLQRDPAQGLSLRKRLYQELKHELTPTRGNRRLWHGYRAVRKLIQRTVRRPLERWRFARGMTRVHVMVRGEQAPNPASRVLLGQERDALGVPQAVLDWRYSGQDKETVRVMTAELGMALERLGIGRLTPSAWLTDPSPDWPLDPTVGNHAIAGYHHMGTTRMSSAPRAGVVDRDCRVHGCDNLYVAGSSVFATSSWANPTLTILALAHRLGDHLLRVSR